MYKRPFQGCMNLVVLFVAVGLVFAPHLLFEVVRTLVQVCFVMTMGWIKEGFK